MPELQVTSWRDLPSLVVVRDGDQLFKVPLPPRFQEAIDEAAMRLGEVDATAYLEGWSRTDWQQIEGSAGELAERTARELDEAWSAERIARYLDTLRTEPGPVTLALMNRHFHP